MFWLFVLSTLAPLALSDGLAIRAITDLAQTLQDRAQARSTRQTALQVFDRLMAARTLLASLPVTDEASSKALRLVQSPLLERMFEQLDAAEPTQVGAALPGSLLIAWEQADGGLIGRSDVPTDVGDAPRHVSLRVFAPAGAAPRLLLGATRGGRTEWVGALRHDFVWAPLVDSAIDSGWRVSDRGGRTLASEGEAALVPSLGEVAEPDAGATQVHRTQLFLAAEFDAAELHFAQKTSAAEITWHGATLERWLALVAAATLLVVAIVCLRQIRRTLVPLDALTAGAKRLGLGTTGARVPVLGNDEFTQLGIAFNDMAARIERQFRSIEAMASIDRDVLAGRGAEAVGISVLQRLAEAHPDVAVTLAWADDDALVRVDRSPAARDPLLGRRSGYATEPTEAIATFVSEEMSAAHEARLAALGLIDIRDAGHLPVVFPICWAERTRALLLLRRGSAGELPAAALEMAGELQARMAVAFSALAREGEMLRRASHDSLTGLVNRHGLNEFLDALLHAPAHGSAPEAAILFVDLDHFKDANDVLGHEAGDEILCEASRRLQSCVAAGTLVGRQGGDEFVIVFPGAGEAAASAAAAGIVAALGEPFSIRGETHILGASVGVALHPAHGSDRQELLRHADMAMYAAKATGRGRAVLYDPSHEAATNRRLRLPGELRRALEAGEFVAYFQPRLSPIDGRVTSAEALVRWFHPERGLQMPGTFIDAAEESPLIEEIGAFMLDAACARMAGWQHAFPDLARVSVNVSPRQLASGTLPALVRATLERHGLSPKTLELEITESLLVDDSARVRGQLVELRGLGVSIALDDFGTGYSSMAMLRNLPIDVMKIDRAFVKDLGSDAGALAIVRAITTLANTLGLHLVAEGVETEAQAALLRSAGCDEFQGYLYSAALCADDFATFCGERMTRRAAA